MFSEQFGFRLIFLSFFVLWVKFEKLDFLTVRAPELLIHIGSSSLFAMSKQGDLEAGSQYLRENTKGGFFILGP